eukprot:scaffold8995_cov139-Cylindrotheca_fusiformis.AAC.12
MASSMSTMGGYPRTILPRALQPPTQKPGYATTSAHVKLLLRLCIQELYAQHEDLPEYDQQLIYGGITMEQRMELPASCQKIWIKRCKVQPPIGNSDIRSFFTPKSTTKG